MEKTRRDIEVELGILIRTARKALGLHQADVAQLVSTDTGQKVTQPMVSDHEKGDWARGHIEDLLGGYGRALRIPEEQLREIIKQPVLGGSSPLPSLEELVKADPTLDDRSKEHLINQYALLQAASRHNRAHPSVAAG